MPDKELTRAGFGPRAAAFILDRALLLIALAIVRAPFAVASFFGAGRLSTDYFLFNHSVLDVVCWLLMSAYFVLMTWFGGATLGKLVMRLRVVREDGEPMRFIDVLYRETIGRFLSGILCIGYLMVLADRQKRGFHDWLCGTCVVYDGVAVPPRRRKEEKPVDYGWSQPEETSAAGPAAPAVSEPVFGWSQPSETPAAEPAPPVESESVFGWSLPGSAPAEETEPENGDDGGAWL